MTQVLRKTVLPDWIYSSEPAKPQQTETSALDAFRQRIYMQQAVTGTDQFQRAPGFDYVRWKQHGQHRMHHNPDEYVRTCQGLGPYISAISSTAWEGMDERRWAGLTTVPPEIPGLKPKSAVGSRSNVASRDVVAA